MGVRKSIGVFATFINLPGRDESLVHRSEAVRLDHQQVIEDRIVERSGKIEIGMLRRIQYRGLVRCAFVVDAQFIFVGQSIGDLQRHRSRDILLLRPG